MKRRGKTYREGRSAPGILSAYLFRKGHRPKGMIQRMIMEAKAFPCFDNLPCSRDEQKTSGNRNAVFFCTLVDITRPSTSKTDARRSILKAPKRPWMGKGQCQH